jgi:hypothetical protein
MEFFEFLESSAEAKTKGPAMLYAPGPTLFQGFTLPAEDRCQRRPSR